MNKKSENLTDGFYSSGEDDGEEKKQESVESSQSEDVVNAGQINFQSNDGESEKEENRNYFPELDQ